jgi:hypothetical protein
VSELTSGLRGLTGAPSERSILERDAPRVDCAVTLLTFSTLTTQGTNGSVVRRDSTNTDRNSDRYPSSPRATFGAEQLIDSLNRAIAELEAVEVDQQHLVVVIDDQTKLWAAYGPFAGPVEALRFEQMLVMEAERDQDSSMTSGVVPLRSTDVAPVTKSSRSWSPRRWLGRSSRPELLVRGA